MSVVVFPVQDVQHLLVARGDPMFQTTNGVNQLTFIPIRSSGIGMIHYETIILNLLTEERFAPSAENRSIKFNLFNQSRNNI